MISGKTVITGGSGSLGTALIQRGFNEGWDWEPTVFSRDEVKQAVLREKFPGTKFVLGDVQDAAALARAFRGKDTVIHAGALKRVPEAEKMPEAYIRANALGSLNVVNEAIAAGVHRVLGISTDKACAPTGVYGSTKLLMERAFQAATTPWGPRFTLVRYGNVLASRGSVIPLFRQQAAAGGPITLTDPEMTRFWITMDDALDLIDHGLKISPGRILVPRGKASSMRVLAAAIAPGVPTTTVGGRGGERQHEQLVNELEAATEVQGGFLLDPAGKATNFRFRSDEAVQFGGDELAILIAGVEIGAEVRTLDL